LSPVPQHQSRSAAEKRVYSWFSWFSPPENPGARVSKDCSWSRNLRRVWQLLVRGQGPQSSPMGGQMIRNRGGISSIRGFLYEGVGISETICREWRIYCVKRTRVWLYVCLKQSQNLSLGKTWTAHEFSTNGGVLCWC